MPRGRAGGRRGAALLDERGDAIPDRSSRSRASASSWCWSTQKWQAAARALEGFKRALYHRRVARRRRTSPNARIHARLGRWTAALGEYRVALADDLRT